MLLSVAVLVVACKAERGEPCERSDDCASGLLCHLAACRDPARFCREQPAHAKRCERDGLCQLVDGVCVAASAEDCTASTRCKDHGRCTFVGPCCSRTDFCPNDDEDPMTHLDRLGDPTERNAALTKLAALVEGALAQDGGGRRGPHAGPLLAEIAAPLSQISVSTALPVTSKAKVLRLLAQTRHPDAAAGLVAALTTYRLDDRPATPLDAAMSHVLAAAADLELAEARPPVFRLYRKVSLRWKKARVDGFSSSLARAVVALAAPAWKADLVAILRRPMKPKDDLDAWLDERYRQRIAAQVLGKLRAEEAVEPLLEVVLTPQKADVAPAALAGLTSVGKPAADATMRALDGTNERLQAFASRQYQAAVEQDLAEATGRTPQALRVEALAVALAHVGRADGIEPVLSALERTDPIGRGRIAQALPALPHQDDVTEAFRQVFEQAPLDLVVSTEHQGLTALIAVVPRLFDCELAPWLVEQALGWPGSDTALAGFREEALRAALLVATSAELAEVERLAELITPEKYQDDLATSRRLLEECKAELSCYVGAVDRKTPNGEPTFVALKAATMSGVVGKPQDESAIAAALTKTPSLEVRRMLAEVLLHLNPTGDAALAAELSQSLGGLATADRTIGAAVARLRARAEP